MAVFNSKYFEEKAMYPKNIDEVAWECKLEMVSFQTKHGRREANRVFCERLLECKYTSSKRSDGFHYYLSQAYRSNEVFIYFQNPYTSKIYLENLSTNVRLLNDRSRLYFDGEKENTLESPREEAGQIQ